jgi:hypothetical protein
MIPYCKKLGTWGKKDLVRNSSRVSQIQLNKSQEPQIVREMKHQLEGLGKTSSQHRKNFQGLPGMAQDGAKQRNQRARRQTDPDNLYG